MKLIVSSTKDLASLNIRKALLKLYSFKESELCFDGNPVLIKDDVALVTVEEELTHAEHVDDLMNAEVALFISRHESISKLPSLLTHVPGCWSRAEGGCRPRSLCRSKPSLLKDVLLELEVQRKKLGLDEWLCGVESTHHGPYLEKTPALFVEIGSSMEEWLNEASGIAVANAIMKALTKKSRYRASICFGGPHYAPKFTKMIIDTSWTPSYIASKHVVDDIDEEILRQALKRSCEPMEAAVLEWKGLKGGQRRTLIKLLEKIGLKVLKVDELMQHGDVY